LKLATRYACPLFLMSISPTLIRRIVSTGKRAGHNTPRHHTGGTNVRYALLIYDNESGYATRSEAENASLMAAWFEYAGSLEKSGKMRGGDALQPTATATTVRANPGRSLVADGPFAETKEQLGGYFIIDAADLDEAIAWAGKMPHLASGGAVEVRPIMEFDR
jgi:hypothetical protein